MGRVNGPWFRSQRLRATVRSLALGAALLVTLVRLAGLVGAQDRPAPVQSLRVGDHTQLAQAVGRVGSRSLIVVTRSGCPACNASTGFYRRLSEEASALNLELTVASNEPLASIESWIQKAGFRGRAVQVKNLSTYGLTVTPTIVMTSPDGQVTDLLLRRLSAQEEAKLVARIRSESAENLDNSRVITELSVAQFTELSVKPRAVVLNVSDRTEFARAHRPGSKNIPGDELQVRARMEFGEGDTIILDCGRRDAKRCEQSAEVLQSLGFLRLYVVFRD